MHFFSCFQVPGGRFPCLQRVCCKPEAHVRMGSSNLIDKQMGLTSNCEPGVSVFSEVGGPFSDPRVSLFLFLFLALSHPPHCTPFILTKVEACALGLIAKLPCMPFSPTGHVESGCSLLTFLHTRESKAMLAHDLVHGLVLLFPYSPWVNQNSMCPEVT